MLAQTNWKGSYKYRCRSSWNPEIYGTINQIFFKKIYEYNFREGIVKICRVGLLININGLNKRVRDIVW